MIPASATPRYVGIHQSPHSQFRAIEEDLLHQLDQFICSARLITLQIADRTWTSVWPGVGFCANHSGRRLLPVCTSLRNPLSPELVWATFIDATEKASERSFNQKIFMPSLLPVAVEDLINPFDYFQRKAGIALYDTNGDGQAHASAELFEYISLACQDLNRQIVCALGIENWGKDVEAILHELGQCPTDLNTGRHDRLISTMTDQWHRIAPHLDAARNASHRTSGPAMLYLIAMYSACAANPGTHDGLKATRSCDDWARAMLDDAQPDPHARLLQATIQAGYKRSIIRAAARMGGQRVRILAEDAEPTRALLKCLEGLKVLGDVGTDAPPTLPTILDAAYPEWRMWPHRVLQLTLSQATATYGTEAYTHFLEEELPTLAEGLKYRRFDPDRLPKNASWTYLITQANFREWAGALPAYCDSGYEIRPVLSSTALLDEGKRMRNCLGERIGYGKICEGGIDRVFSIRDAATEERVAIAVIQICSRVIPWQLVEVKGPHNLEVVPLVAELANRIAFLYFQNDKEDGTLWNQSLE